jgi:predicted dehydrogenase
MGGEDTAVLVLEYVSGVTGTLTMSIGTAASLYFDWQSGLWTGKGRAWEPAQPVMSKAPEPPDSFAYWGESIHACVCAFVRDVHAGREPAMPGDAGRHDLAIILAAHESARTGQMIPVSVRDTRPVLANNRELSFYEQTT